MRSKWQLCSVVTLVLLAAACAAPAAPPEEPAAPAVSQEEDHAAIRAVIEEFTAVAYSGDFEGYMAFYTDDAVMLSPGQPAHVGRDAIRARDEPLFEDTDGEWTTVVEDIRLDGDTAIVRTSYRETWTRETTTNSAVGKEVFVLERQPDGSWLVDLLMWNLLEPVKVVEASDAE